MPHLLNDFARSQTKDISATSRPFPFLISFIPPLNRCELNTAHTRRTTVQSAAMSDNIVNGWTLGMRCDSFNGSYGTCYLAQVRLSVSGLHCLPFFPLPPSSFPLPSRPSHFCHHRSHSRSAHTPAHPPPSPSLLAATHSKKDNLTAYANVMSIDHKLPKTRRECVACRPCAYSRPFSPLLIFPHPFPHLPVARAV
jgi:hypothetical protein